MLISINIAAGDLDDKAGCSLFKEKIPMTLDDSGSPSMHCMNRINYLYRNIF